MTDTIILAGPTEVSVTIKRHHAARRLSLRVNQIDGRTTLTAPRWAKARDIHQFLNDKHAWILQSLPKEDTRPRLRPGAALPIEGAERIITPDPENKGPVLMDAARLIVPEWERNGPRKVMTFVKHLARDRIVPCAEDYAHDLDAEFGRITLRDTRSRWGSCTAEGNLMLSWRLIMAPPVVLRYVVAHEVAHLREMNHSPRFWGLVERLMPDFDTHRKWLKKHGRTLQAWQFDD